MRKAEGERRCFIRRTTPDNLGNQEPVASRALYWGCQIQGSFGKAGKGSRKTISVGQHMDTLFAVLNVKRMKNFKASPLSEC